LTVPLVGKVKVYLAESGVVLYRSEDDGEPEVSLAKTFSVAAILSLAIESLRLLGEAAPAAARAFAY
jgi:hypothetical protein